MRNSDRQDRNAALQVRETKKTLEDEVDALFRFPLTEFTGARNGLASRLKKTGGGDDAARVKALAKPPVSAWAVNQLYWNHRAAFDRLIVSGERFHKAQTSGKIGEMRSALDARREALMDLSDLATSLLRDAGHNPSLDIVRRITSTLEAMSAKSNWASRSDAPRPGRLTHDVDPPGFESFGSFVPAAGMKKTTKEPTRFTPSPKSSGRPLTGRKVAPDNHVRKLEETRKAKLAAAKVTVQNAKKSLTQARAKAQSLEAAQKKADAEAKKAEKLKRNAEDSLEKAEAAFQDAARRARSIAAELGKVASALEDGERNVEKASRELNSLFRESSGR